MRRGRKMEHGASLLPSSLSLQAGGNRRRQQGKHLSILLILGVSVLCCTLRLVSIVFFKEPLRPSQEARKNQTMKNSFEDRCNWETVRNEYTFKQMHTRRRFIHSGFTSIDIHRREMTGDGAGLWSSAPKLEEKCPLNFTLVTQATPERIWMLKFICRRWTGPIVIAVYIDKDKDFSPDSYQSLCPQVEFHVLTASSDIFLEHSLYPVNRLRNTAIKHVKTSHFLLCDIDLWPDSTLFKRLQALASTSLENTHEIQQRSLLLDPLRAIVIPAFAREVKTDCSSSTGIHDSNASYRMRECYREAERMPTSFGRLKQCIIKKECHIFDRYNQDGHGTTDYRAWLKQDSSDLRHIKCFLSNRYEPYVVLHKSPLLPTFEEKFTGYGKNKIENLVHLRYAGYHFSVLPKSFLVHFPHHKSAARMEWEQSNNKEDASRDAHRATMDRLYRRFLDTLISIYGSPGDRPETTKLCGPADYSSSRSDNKHSAQGRRQMKSPRAAAMKKSTTWTNASRLNSLKEPAVLSARRTSSNTLSYGPSSSLLPPVSTVTSSSALSSGSTSPSTIAQTQREKAEAEKGLSSRRSSTSSTTKERAKATTTAMIHEDKRRASRSQSTRALEEEKRKSVVNVNKQNTI